MKTLRSLTNVDKAKLLHELFPNEIPLLLDEILAVCEDFRKHRTAYNEQWKSGFMTFENWLLLAEKAEKVILKSRKNLEKSSKVFSEQLFNSWDYTVLFVNDRVCKYAEKTEDQKFKIAVELIFNP